MLAESAFEATILALKMFESYGRPLADRAGAVELTVGDKRHVVRVLDAFAWLERHGKTPVEQARKRRLRELLTDRG